MNYNNPRILVVDNYDSYTYNLIQILEEDGMCDPDVIKNDVITIETAKPYDAILFSPGPGVPSEVPVLSELLMCYHTTKSFLGICLGHQAIAETFGGKIVNPGSVYHGLKTEVRIIDDTDYLFKGIPKNFEAGLYHSWAVSLPDLPAGLKVTALSDDGIIMALAHKTSDVRGVQFHPESFMTRCGRQIIINWTEHLRNALKNRLFGDQPHSEL